MAATENDRTLLKKTRSKTPNLHIDIDCIEDEYSRKTAVRAPIYQGTPLFASLPKIKEDDPSTISMKLVTHEPVCELDSWQKSRVSLEEPTVRLVGTANDTDKYSYDNLIEAIKIHHHRQGSQLSTEKDRRSPSPLHEISREYEQKRNIPCAEPQKEVRMGREEHRLPTSCNAICDPIKKQFRRAKDELDGLKNMLKGNRKLTEIQQLMDALERQLEGNRQPEQPSPKRNAPKQPLRRLSPPSELAEIQNSFHFQSIHQKYNSKERQPPTAASQSNLRKFNTEHEQPKAFPKNTSTKSPFREILSYMNKRR